MKCKPYTEIISGWLRGPKQLSWLHKFPTNETTSTPSSGLDFNVSSLPCNWKWEIISYWEKLHQEPLSQTTIFTLGQLDARNEHIEWFLVRASQGHEHALKKRKLIFWCSKKNEFWTSDNFHICKGINGKF